MRRRRREVALKSAESATVAMHYSVGLYGVTQIRTKLPVCEHNLEEAVSRLSSVIKERMDQDNNGKWTD